MRWIVSFPCWGEDYRRRALEGPLQSIFLALDRAGAVDPLVIINTDDYRTFAPLVSRLPFDVRFYSVPTDLEPTVEKYRVFGACHQQAIDLAEPGDRVSFMCGDMTISTDAFSAADRIFETGKKIIMGAASGTVGPAPLVPSRQLLDWSLDHLAPMCRDLFWKEGRGSFPWCVYFRHERGIDFRGFHIHPFAVVKHEGLRFSGTTVDFDLCDQFPTADVHVVTHPDELAMVARVPDGGGTRPRAWKIRAWSVVSWASAMGHYATPRHIWNFTHQITLKGEPDPNNQAIADDIVARIERRWRVDHKTELRLAS